MAGGSKCAASAEARRGQSVVSGERLHRFPAYAVGLAGDATRCPSLLSQPPQPHLEWSLKCAFHAGGYFKDAYHSCSKQRRPVHFCGLRSERSDSPFDNSRPFSAGRSLRLPRAPAYKIVESPGRSTAKRPGPAEGNRAACGRTDGDESILLPACASITARP